jgi:hypothetical protein
MSFTHIVVFTWSEDPGGRSAIVAEALREFTADLPGVVSYRCGPDAGLASTNAEFAIVGDFASRQDFESYRDHPRHQEILREQILPSVKDRVVVRWDGT